MTDRPGLSPSQTVGPYLRIGLIRELVTAEVVPRSDPRAIVIRGRLLDGDGAPVPDGMVETWQANAAGRYAHPGDRREQIPLEPGFIGFGRSETDGAGRFEIVTVQPGRVPFGDGRVQAPHLAVLVFARGLLKHLVTRIYFPDEVDANGEDPVLAALTEGERRTLVGEPEDGFVRFDVHLQGPHQTTFFAL